MLQVHYSKGMRYRCVNGNINQGVPICISFGGVRVDQVVSMEILKAIQPMAIDAALQAAEQVQGRRIGRVRVVTLPPGDEASADAEASRPAP